MKVNDSDIGEVFEENRYFYYYLDKVNFGIAEREDGLGRKLEDASSFDKLKELVENIYSNDYLAKVCTNWNDLFNAEVDSLEITKQPEFYNRIRMQIKLL